MKRLCCIAVAVLGGWLGHAQTNSTSPPATPRGPTIITSDTADFDLSGHEATYRGHVRVDDPQMKLVCEKLVADVPSEGGHVNHIVAETNVVIDFLDNRGNTNHATSDKAVYVYTEQGGVTNETVTLTGNAQMENTNGWLTGEPIVWDRQNNHLSASNHKMIYRQNFTGPAPTNSATGNTNMPAGHRTNAPPSTAENKNLLPP
ncbi:MAG TPA: LptA/OstA family protein [Candidatus Acidoferrum sp.]|nr:LptA/OstA family protein [Candidatus Acidoferrum sp.]